MLVLTRRHGESIVVAGVEIKLEYRRGRIRCLIDSRESAVDRKEYLTTHPERRLQHFRDKARRRA